MKNRFGHLSVLTVALIPDWNVLTPNCLASLEGCPERSLYFLLTKILMVDDHRGVCAMFRSLLEKHRFNVCGEASNGKEAIERVRDLNPDIVLLDICMPVMNGIEAAYEIRRIAPTTRIVFLTVAGELMNDVHPISHGFVHKATANSELIPTLNRLINSRLQYPWQQVVMDVFQETRRERLPAKINLAERAIDVRLRTGPAPDQEEHCALRDALSVLEDLASQQGQEKLQDEREEHIA